MKHRRYLKVDNNAPIYLGCYYTREPWLMPMLVDLWRGVLRWVNW